MRFMILRKADASTEAGLLPTADLLEAMGQYIREMAEADVLLSAEGLQASSKGIRVNFVNGVATVTPGPFPSPKDLLAGYCVIQVQSLQEAIAWVKRWPTRDGDGNVEIEIRQVFEADDFGVELSPELRDAEQNLRARAA
jgi:hypothetical protein